MFRKTQFGIGTNPKTNPASNCFRKTHPRSSRKDQLEPYDSFILFFSSHGNEHGIYCRDSNVEDSNVVRFSEIVKVLKTSDCFGEKPVLIFFLCCRGGLFLISVFP